MKRDYDVIVVGGGPGGISCAALLAKKGARTLVLEKNDRVGGKPATLSTNGFTCERWPTGGLPVKGGSWLEVFKALGIESRFRVVVRDVAVVYRRNDGQWIRRVTQMDPYVLPDPNNLFDDWGLNEKERQIALQVLTDVATLSGDRLDALDNVSVHEFLMQYGGVPGPLYGYFAFLAHAFNVMTAELRSVYDGLEQKVSERTRQLTDANRELRYKAMQLKLSAEVGRVATSILDLDILLDRVTRLVLDTYAHVYEVSHVTIWRQDDLGGRAECLASSGEGTTAVAHVGVGDATIVGQTR